MPRYTISDIHGCLDTFQTLLHKINFSKTDTLYLLGDYIDRGPNSKGVIDFIWELQRTGHDVRCLRGNHEQLALNNLQPSSDKYYDKAFLNSFGVSTYEEVPTPYYEWMDKLVYYFETEGYILTHAGLNFLHPNPLADTTSMMWIRESEKQVNTQWLAGRILIHGHTPQSKIAIEYNVQALDRLPVLNIDGGCVFSHLTTKGYLCAFNLDTHALSFEKRVSLNAS